MAYSNPFLCEFAAVFDGILQEKQIPVTGRNLLVIDEEPDEGIFEPLDVTGVLVQIAESVRCLQIYTNRPAYFAAFIETMYEENGLLTVTEPKEKLKQRLCRAKSGQESDRWIVLDFEWQGCCYPFGAGISYIPIHKKPWEMAENLDIAVPIGYNTVIVKRVRTAKKVPQRDRFEQAFYGTES